VSVFVEAFGHLTELSITHAFRAGPQVDLHPDAQSPRVARAFVREHVPDVIDLRDNAELLASELVTNAVLHAHSEMTLGVVSRDSSVLIAVSDHSPLVPAERRASLVAEHGRGITLVAAIAQTWGVTAQPGGKIIWCLIRAGDDGVS
jgi:anti-sigma regulatory factor (Ser/Thr protein kinase)